MKICLITPYYMPIKGGISNYVLSLSENLSEKNQETYIITRQGIKDAEEVYVSDVNKIFFILKAFFRIRALKPDVLHSHAHWYLLAPCVIYKFFKPNTCVIHTFHTDPINKTSGFKLVVMKRLLSRCDTLTFVSKHLHDKIMDNFDINIKTKIIYGGVSPINPDEYEINQFKRKFNLENHYPIISFVGALSWKMKAEGVKILSKAFKEVLIEFPNSRLLIVGDGTYRYDIESLVKELGIESEVIFTGFVDNAFIPLAASDIYAHISLQEGFPLAVLEAMGLGKPVVASNTGGIPEVIINGENGILVESNSEDISNSLIELINSKEKRCYLGHNAKDTTFDKFTWSKITDNVLSIYKNSRD